jgi:mono/diheme cytochrome c family protein
MNSYRQTHRGSILQLAVFLVLTGFASSPLAQDGSAFAPDYARDVAPILQQKCVSCHNPDGIGPMPLQS